MASPFSFLARHLGKVKTPESLLAQFFRSEMYKEEADFLLVMPQLPKSRPKGMGLGTSNPPASHRHPL